MIDANSGPMAAAWAGLAHDTGDKDGKAVLEASDNVAGLLSEAETAKVMALGDEVTAEWVAEMTGKGLDGTAMVEDARAFVAAAEEKMKAAQ